MQIGMDDIEADKNLNRAKNSMRNLLEEDITVSMLLGETPANPKANDIIPKGRSTTHIPLKQEMIR